MQNNKSSLRDIKARNVAGRDFVNQEAPKTQMQILLDRLKDQEAEEDYTSEMIAELEHYQSNMDPDGFLGLNKKLELGNRQDEAEEAEELKEIVFKKLVKHQNLEAAQEIFALLLSTVWSAFRSKIKPMIKEGRSRSEIDEAIHINVIVPIRDMLDENVLRIYDHEIYGFVYLLTGNCHIRWD